MAVTTETGREVTDVEKMQVVLGVLQAAAGVLALYLIFQRAKAPKVK